MTELKFCKDCKHCLPRRSSFGAGCAKEFTVNLVNGYVNYTGCELVRSSDKHCGKSGEWWEATPPKPVKFSLWQRFKAHSMSGATNFGPM